MIPRNHCTECGCKTDLDGLCYDCRLRDRCHGCGSTIYYDGLCHQCTERQRREGFLPMSETQIAEKVEEIIAQLDDFFEEKKEYDIFFRLLAYQNTFSTAKIAEAAMRARVYRPFELYCDAGPEVREHLIALLMEPDWIGQNYILQCLAMAGGEDALATFKELATHPLPWSETLHLPLLNYTHASGWAIDQHGNRVELIFHECWPVFPVTASAQVDTAVSVATPHADCCPRCGSPLIDLLTIDGNDERLAFLNLPGVIRIVICLWCVCFCERLLIRYSPNGNSNMEFDRPFRDDMPDNEDKEMTAKFLSKPFALAKKPESVHFVKGNDEDIITIGGFAKWIQGYQYDTCPDCGKKMRYFASVPWEAWFEPMEGTLYIEICTDCQIIEVFHQQT